MSRIKKNKEWSRAIICLPKPNIKGKLGHRARNFVPSFDCTPVSMPMLIGGQYAQIWLAERNEFIKQREKAVKAKFIKNDFDWWLKLRKTHKRFCCMT